MKKNKMIGVVLCLIMAMCSVFAIGCDNTKPEVPEVPEEPAFELSLDKTEVVLNKGETVTLTATEGGSTLYLWHAEDPSLVRVVSRDNTCEISSRGDGVTKVIVKVNGQEKACTVYASIDNFDRVASMLYYCDTNLDTTLNSAKVSEYESGIRTFMAFEEGSVVIAEITLMPKDSFAAGKLNTITITVSFNLYSTIPLAKQILNSSNIYITYYYPGPQEGLLASGSYKISNLIYTIDSQNNVNVSDGTMTNISNLNSIGSYYKGLIVNGTISLLNDGMTEFIKAINEKCSINICK